MPSLRPRWPHRAARRARPARPPGRHRRSWPRGSAARCTCGAGTAPTPPCPTPCTARSTPTWPGQPVAPRPPLVARRRAPRRRHDASGVGAPRRRPRRPLAAVAPAADATHRLRRWLGAVAHLAAGHGRGRARRAGDPHRPRHAGRPLGARRRRTRRRRARRSWPRRCRRSASRRRTTRRRSSTSTPRWSTRWPATASPTATGGPPLPAVADPADVGRPRRCSAPSPRPIR